MISPLWQGFKINASELSVVTGLGNFCFFFSFTSRANVTIRRKISQRTEALKTAGKAAADRMETARTAGTHRGVTGGDPRLGTLTIGAPARPGGGGPLLARNFRILCLQRVTVATIASLVWLGVPSSSSLGLDVGGRWHHQVTGAGMKLREKHIGIGGPSQRASLSQALNQPFDGPLGTLNRGFSRRCSGY